MTMISGWERSTVTRFPDHVSPRALSQPSSCLTMDSRRRPPVLNEDGFKGPVMAAGNGKVSISTVFAPNYLTFFVVKCNFGAFSHSLLAGVHFWFEGDSANMPGQICSNCISFRNECTHVLAEAKKVYSQAELLSNVLLPPLTEKRTT